MPKDLKVLGLKICAVLFRSVSTTDIGDCGGEDFNQFLIDIPSFWCVICLCSWIRSYLPPKKYWWDTMAVHSNCWPLIPYLYYPCTVASRKFHNQMAFNIRVEKWRFFIPCHSWCIQRLVHGRKSKRSLHLLMR